MTVATEPIRSSAAGASVVFQPVPVPNARIVDGNTFPLALSISKTSTDSAPLTVDEAAAAIRDVGERKILKDLLDKHGAVLIRGIGNPTPETFSKLIIAAREGMGRQPYEQIGFSGSRTDVDKEVFSASEAPPNVKIFQHSENSIHTRFPSNIHFYCVKAASKGGESPLRHCGEFFDRVQAEMPQFVEELAERGLLTTETYQAPGNESDYFPLTWAGTSAFGKHIVPGDDLATMKAKAEKEVARLTPHFKWNEDNSLETQEHVPGFRRDPKSGRPLWYNCVGSRYLFAQAVGADKPPYLGSDGLSYPPSNYRYRDGSLIKMEWLARLAEISDSITFDFTMQPGDLILVNNYLVSHGRDPWYEGERRIIVSMWDTDKPEERIKDY